MKYIVPKETSIKIDKYTAQCMYSSYAIAIEVEWM